jgi:phosphoserine phosphatase
MVLKCIRPPTLARERIKEIHIFDLDRTLACSNSSLLFAGFLKEKGVISQKEWLGFGWAYLLYRMRLASLENQARSTFSRFFRGKSSTNIIALLPLFWQDVLSKEMREDLCDHLNQMQKRGAVTAIYSASCDFLVEWVARQLQVHFVLASESTISPCQHTFLDLGTIANGAIKARSVQRLRYRFPSAIVYGYSDSIDDAPFLDSVDFPFLVSPDAKLKKWALQKPKAAFWPGT